MQEDLTIGISPSGPGFLCRQEGWQETTNTGLPVS